MSNIKKTVLVTGALSGIGEATAIALHEAGYKVYAAARRTDRMQHLEKQGIQIISLDVTVGNSMLRAVKKIEKDFGLARLCQLVPRYKIRS